MIKKFDLDRGLAKLYSQSNTQKDQRENDLACWFNLQEFAEYHDIDGHKILGVMTSDIRGQRAQQAMFSNDNAYGVSKSNAKLFLKVCDVDNINTDQPLRIDGRLYQVTQCVKIGGVIWSISLMGNVS